MSNPVNIGWTCSEGQRRGGTRDGETSSSEPTLIMAMGDLKAVHQPADVQ